MTLEECIDYAEKQSEWMSKYTMIDIYKDKLEYYRQLAEWLRELKAYREAEKYKWNNHQVACLLADIFGDTCACNYNGNDEWLPLKCELLDACPNTVGVAYWEQYLKHREVNDE